MAEEVKTKATIVEEYQKKFRELTQRKEEALKVLAPHREYYEKHVNDPKYLAAKKAIKEANAILGPIDTELAIVARAIGGKGIKIEPGSFSTQG